MVFPVVTGSAGRTPCVPTRFDSRLDAPLDEPAVPPRTGGRNRDDASAAWLIVQHMEWFPRNPEEPRGTPRNPEEPRGTPQPHPRPSADRSLAALREAQVSKLCNSGSTARQLSISDLRLGMCRR
jgi:hypothetical protein